MKWLGSLGSVLVVVMLAACGKGGPATPDKAPAVVTAVEHAPLVQAYEALRDRFASDDLKGAQAAAAALQKIASGAMEAQAGAVTKAPEIEAARAAFGQLSKAYLELLVAKPELAQGLVAFRCPMAEGYQKWVQIDEPLRNPYMGKRMLECGSKVALAP